MKTLLATLAAAGALTAIAAPVAAQPYGYDRPYADRHYDGWDHGRSGYDRWERGGYDIERREAQLRRRIDIAARQGALSPRELGELRRSVWSIDRLEASYRRDGRINWRERAELDRRLDQLEARIASRIENRDYGYGYGYLR